MFFDSIADGVLILTYWRFWATVAGAGILSISPFLLLGILTYRSEIASSAAGCLLAPFLMLWAPLVLTTMLIVLAPLMIFRIDEISLRFAFLFSYWDIAKIILSGLVAMFAVAVIPIVGRIGTLPLFSQAAAVLATILLIVSRGQAEVWPGFLTGAGLAVVGSIVATAIFYVVMLPFAALSIVANEAASFLIAQPLGLIPAAVPVCIYAGWLRQANGL